ncbi:MAG: rhodanese-like domain-containing protein [Acidimicrobiales bacterium]|jgi:rhodanese-related sulfurtransferase
MSPSADDLVDLARRHIDRTEPQDLAAVSSAGGLIIDIRPGDQRASEGELPGALVVERNVLEWRLDPAGSHRLPEVTGFDQPVVVVCSAGYASSLAAESLATLGYRHASDLAGGYQAWAAWRASSRPQLHEATQGS